MTIFAGLDVSDKMTHVCVVDGEGTVLRRDVVASDPDVLAKWLNRHCRGLGGYSGGTVTRAITPKLLPYRIMNKGVVARVTVIPTP